MFNSLGDSVATVSPSAPDSPILIVPYMWIGDFVRCHTVVRLLAQRFPSRPIDLLATQLVAPLADYMPGVRKAIVFDLPRKRLALAQHRGLALLLKHEGYAQALIMPRTWKAALAPFLAGIPTRTGFVGEARIGVVNDLRFGERRLPRMIDRCVALSAAVGDAPPKELPVPQLRVAPVDLEKWRSRMGLTVDGRRIVAMAPGAVGPSKRWPMASFGQLAAQLTALGHRVWVLGGPGEQEAARHIAHQGGSGVLDLTGPDLRNAILALAAADVAVSNDSGLLHVAAALDTPAVGIFGPTSPWHWAPLNPLAATIEFSGDLSCRPCHRPVCRLGHHRCMQGISIEHVADAVLQALAQ